jgi:glyoxylase-like metal-dependent hydrolase (beta-lactamase superfamily II)
VLQARGRARPLQRRHALPRRPGNTEGDTGRFAQIIEQVDRKLFTLPPDTIVLPGHGADTTVGAERPHLDEWVERGW